jgi:long-chain fatty acid transport protein
LLKLTSILHRVPLRLFLLLTFVWLASQPSSWGGAFSISELGARAAGMGTAFTSLADDGSALVYNPAGIGFQPGTRLEMDEMTVIGLFRFFPGSPLPGQVVPSNGFSGSIKPHFIPVASMFMTKEVSHKVTFGFGVFTPFGLSANFTNFHDSDPALTKFPGRWAGTRARLESFWFQPTIAFRLTPNSSLAVGGAVVHTHLLIEQSILNPRGDALTFGQETASKIFPGVDPGQAAASIARLLPEGRSRIAGTSNSPAFNIGYLYKHPHGKINIGLSYRSAVTNHLSGRASFAFPTNFTLSPFIGADLLSKAFPNQPIKGSFTEPATYAIGLSTSAMWHTTFSVDGHFQDYRRFSSVPVNFSITQATNSDARTPAEKRLVFDFRNGFQVAFGVERPVSKTLTIRAGYLYDSTPVVDKSVGPLFPDASRHSATVGVSKRVGNKEFTLFYEAMKFVDRTTNVAANNNIGTNGEYRNFAHVAGMALRFTLGGTKLSAQSDTD